MNADGTNQHATGIAGNRPRWSPDGSQIIFTVLHHGDPMQGKNRFTETFIINADGNDRRLVMSTQHLQWRVDFVPAWSPDGSRIAFCSNRPGRYDIFVIDVSGENLTNLTQAPDTSELSPSWSPDGTYILYSSEHLYTLRLADRHKTQLTQDEKIRRNPDWSPDGKYIAFSGVGRGKQDNEDIYIMDIETGVEKRLTIHPDNDFRPAWSPDGEHIVFKSDRGDPDKGDPLVDGDGKMDLYRITVASREVGRLTHLPGGGDMGDADWCCRGQNPTAVNPRHHKLIRWGQLKADR